MKLSTRLFVSLHSIINLINRPIKRQMILLWLACLIPFVNALAQKDTIPVFEIKTDTILNQPLPGDQLLVLEDNNGKLTFEKEWFDLA